MRNKMGWINSIVIVFLFWIISPAGNYLTPDNSTRRIKGNPQAPAVILFNALRLRQLPLINLGRELSEIIVTHRLGKAQVSVQELEGKPALKVNYDLDPSAGEVRLAFDLESLGIAERLREDPGYSHLGFDILGGLSHPLNLKVVFRMSDGGQRELSIAGLRDFILGEAHQIQEQWQRVALNLESLGLIPTDLPQVRTIELVVSGQDDSDGQGELFIRDLVLEEWRGLGLEEGVEEIEISLELALEKWLGENPGRNPSLRELKDYLEELTGQPQEIRVIKRNLIDLNLERQTQGLRLYRLSFPEGEEEDFRISPQDLDYAYQGYLEKNQGALPRMSDLQEVMGGLNQTAGSKLLTSLNTLRVREGKPPLITQGRRDGIIPSLSEILGAIQAFPALSGLERPPTIDELADRFYPQEIILPLLDNDQERYQQLRERVKRGIERKIFLHNESLLREGLEPIQLTRPELRTDLTPEEVEGSYHRLREGKAPDYFPTIQEIAEDLGAHPAIVGKILAQIDQTRVLRGEFPLIYRSLTGAPLRLRLAAGEADKEYDKFLELHHRAPTAAELAERLGSTIPSVFNNLSRERKKIALGWSRDGLIDEEIILALKLIQRDKGVKIVEPDDLIDFLRVDETLSLDRNTLLQRALKINRVLQELGAEGLPIAGLEEMEAEKPPAETEVEQAYNSYWRILREVYHISRPPTHSSGEGLPTREEVAQELGWPAGRLYKHQALINNTLAESGRPPLIFRDNWDILGRDLMLALKFMIEYLSQKYAKLPTKSRVVKFLRPLYEELDKQLLERLLAGLNGERRQFGLPPIQLPE